MATFFLPPTVLRSSGEWPCTSALGLRTRRYSASRSKRSPLSNTTVIALRSLRSRSSVGQGFDAAALISISLAETSSSSRSLRAQSRAALEARLERHQEPRRLPAGHHAVIEGERNRQHAPHGRLSIMHHHPLINAAGPHDRHLGRHHDEICKAS